MSTKFDKNYMVVVESGILADITIFDKTRMSITTLKNGTFKDITEDCQKLTKRKQKVVGGLAYQFLHNEIDSSSACIWEEKIMYHTDKEDTGLPYIIWITPSSGKEKHWARIKVSYKNELILVSISDDPKIMIKGKQLPKFSVIKKFIVDNKDLLLEYWNSKGNMSLKIIFDRLKKVG